MGIESEVRPAVTGDAMTLTAAYDAAKTVYVTPSEIAVPTKNSSANTSARDVMGSKEDDEDGNSVYSYLYIINKHFHSIGMVYPLLADPVTLQKQSGIWAAFNTTTTEIIPANTVTVPFDLHFANVTNLSATGNYLIAFYYGAIGAEVLCGYSVATRTAVGGTEGSCPIISGLATGKPIPANSRISAALSSGNNAQDTLQIKVQYHGY